MKTTSKMLTTICVACAMIGGCDTSDSGEGATGSQGGGTASRTQVTLGSATLVGSSDAGVDRFLGIPYAAPPTDALRWHATQAPAALTGMVDATRFGSPCPQLASPAGPSDPSHDEDCLYLNVYRPEAAQTADLPVMVFIHGGSNTSGSAEDYDPTAFVKENGVIVVTINYRLGVFGFLPMPTADAPDGSESGNFALMDQQFALRWVQQYIAAFGGDPQQVTVAGESAGAFGICAHLASPMAAGLFQRAIMQSFKCAEATKETAVANAQTVTQALHCDTASDVAACMGSQSVLALLAASLKVTSYDAYVDGQVLPEPSELTISAGNWNTVPVLLGSDNDEAALVVLGALNSNNVSLPLTQDSYDSILSSKLPNAAPAIEAEYDPAAYPNLFAALSSEFTDASFLGCAITPQADLFGSVTPTYRYEFSDPGTPLPTTLGASSSISIGAYHSGEMQYLFAVQGFGGPVSTDQQALSERMIRYWGDFVKTGSPGDDTHPWPEYESSGRNLLILSPGADQISDTFDSEHHCSFWASLASP